MLTGISKILTILNYTLQFFVRVEKSFKHLGHIGYKKSTHTNFAKVAQHPQHIKFRLCCDTQSEQCNECLTSTYSTPISLRLSGMLCDESKLITPPKPKMYSHQFRLVSTKQIQTHSSVSTHKKKKKNDYHHFNIYLKY